MRLDPKIAVRNHWGRACFCFHPLETTVMPMLQSMLMSRILTFAFLAGFTAGITLPVNDVAAQDILGGARSRQLAPGVLTTVAPNIDVNEGVVYPRPVPGLNIPQYTPNTIAAAKTLEGQMGARIRYRDVWQLDFAFKNLRHAEVELPLVGGQTQVAEVWYMIYRVRNLNKHLSFVEDEQKGGRVPNLETPVDQLDPTTLPGRFFPSFLLEGWVENPDGQYVKKAYRDTVLPQAVGQIAAQEKMSQLFDRVEIAKEMLQPATASSEGTWGVAIWLDVDPRINFATVSVQGLSNAFRTDQDGGDDADKHRIKTLQINFWRPGDADLEGDVFRPGILIDEKLSRQISLLKKYDLPGPDLGIYWVNPSTLVTSKVGRVSADYDLETLKSAAIEELSGQQMPANLVEFLAKYGFKNAENLAVETTMAASTESNSGRWTLTDADGGKFIVEVEPVIWRVKDGKIEFVGGLDYFWDYRYIH